jgi:hypothetical protein
MRYFYPILAKFSDKGGVRPPEPTPSGSANGMLSRGLATLGVLLQGDDGGRPSDFLGVGTGLLEDAWMVWSSIRLWIGPNTLRKLVRSLMDPHGIIRGQAS